MEKATNFSLIKLVRYFILILICTPFCHASFQEFLPPSPNFLSVQNTKSHNKSTENCLKLETKKKKISFLYISLVSCQLHGLVFVSSKEFMSLDYNHRNICNNAIIPDLLITDTISRLQY